MSAANGIKLGTTLYSMTNEFHGREYDFEGLLAKVSELKLGPGVEVVGYQSIRGFPTITDDFARTFRDLFDKYELEQSALGINADVLIRRDKPMSDDESADYHIAQIEAAAKLGFPVARFQYAAGPEVIRRLAPLAEKLKVKLGLEVHAPHAVDSPDVMAYRELYEELDSPYLGFIPDFGASARTIPPSFLDYFRDIGLPEELITLALDIWHQPGDREERIIRFRETAEAQGYPAIQIFELYIIFGLFSRQEPEAWLELMPRIVHIHGKFFDFDDSGNEVAIDYPGILTTLQGAGVSCFMSSEWEGHLYSDASGLEKVKAHHALCRRILGYH